MSSVRVLLFPDFKHPELAKILFPKIIEQLKDVETVIYSSEPHSSLPSLKETVIFVKQHIAIKPVIIIGHGYGGSLALATECMLSGEKGFHKKALCIMEDGEMKDNPEAMVPQETGIKGLILIAQEKMVIEGCPYVTSHFYEYLCKDDTVNPRKERDYMNLILFKHMQSSSIFTSGGHDFKGREDELVKGICNLVTAYSKID